MYFFARDEANLLVKKLRRQIADQPEPKFVLYYKSGDRNYSDAANAITAGEFTEATLHFLFCVSGDGWNEGTATSERWGQYRQWRGANGENRRLYEAPGISSSLTRLSSCRFPRLGQPHRRLYPASHVDSTSAVVLHRKAPTLLRGEGVPRRF
jgi:hypothetical protein